MTFAAHVVRNYYAAFNRRDHRGMLDLLSEDVAHDVNQGGREVGRDAFARFLSHMDRCYAEQVEELVVTSDDSSTRCAAEFQVSGTYLQSDPGFPAARGQTYRLPAGAFFELRAGCITRVTTYYNVREWLRQVQSVQP